MAYDDEATWSVVRRGVRARMLTTWNTFHFVCIYIYIYIPLGTTSKSIVCYGRERLVREGSGTGSTSFPERDSLEHVIVVSSVCSTSH